MELNGGGWRRGRGSRCLFSPPDVGEVGRLLCPLRDPVGPFGAGAPSFDPGVGVALGTSLPLGCPRALPVLGVGVGHHVPTASTGPAAFPRPLLLSVHGRGAEAQDGAEAPPVLFTLGLDAPGYCLLHLLAAGQQDVH